MFKIYNLNMKEIPFPDGVVPLEIFVGSVGKERTVDTVDGRPGVVDYGFNYTDRPVSLFLRIKATDKIDFRLLRNEVFAIFDIGSAFYVAESDVPSRVLKVVVDESYIPDRLTEEYADFDINCRTLDSVFWESKYTTLELHDSGYSATAEKYGLVDNIDDEKVKYRFKNDSTVLSTNWNDGGISTANGDLQPNNVNNIHSGEIAVMPGQRIVLEDIANHPNINFWRVFEYDDGTFIGFIEGKPGTNSVELTTRGDRLRFATSVYPNMPVRVANVGNLLNPVVKRLTDTSNFTVYNAGNVTVEPESAQLYIQLNYVTSDGNLKVTNKTTGESFEYYQSTDRRHIVLDGMVMTVGGVNRFRDTNKRFISLVPGDNQFEILNGTFEEIRFEFKYLYK